MVDLHAKSSLRHPDRETVQKPDGAVFVGGGSLGVTWEKMIAVLEYKKSLSDGTAFSDACVEVVERAYCCFEKQSERKFFEGLVMDSKLVAFCRVSRDLHLQVTNRVPLWTVFEKDKPVVLAPGGEAMLKFLTMDRGYVPLSVPVFFGMQASECIYRSDSKGAAVMKLSETQCCKIGPRKMLEHEVTILQSEMFCSVAF